MAVATSTADFLEAFLQSVVLFDIYENSTANDTKGRAQMMTAEPTTDREIVISRLFDAPREVVFEAWVRPEALAAWWGPRDWSITTESIDVRTGGHWKYVMHGPGDLHFPNYSEFYEVTPPERLVYRHGAQAEETAVDFNVTVTFEDQGGKTFLTMTSLFSTKEARDMVVREFGAIEGGRQTLEKLAAYLAGR